MRRLTDVMIAVGMTLGLALLLVATALLVLLWPLLAVYDWLTGRHG